MRVKSEVGGRKSERFHRPIPPSAFRLPNFLAVVALVCFTAWMLTPVAWGCPACKEALFDPAQAQQTINAAKGYALSIGLMLGMPLALIGGISAALVHHVRQEKVKSQKVKVKTTSQK